VGCHGKKGRRGLPTPQLKLLICEILTSPKSLGTILAYNEEDNIGNMIRALPSEFCSDVKALVFNDGSADETASWDNTIQSRF